MTNFYTKKVENLLNLRIIGCITRENRGCRSIIDFYIKEVE